MEKEIKFLDILCEKDKISVDVGANEGEYTEALLLLSKEVYAYEPIPELAARLRQKFLKAIVKKCALSDTVGTATLYIPDYRDAEGQVRMLDGWASMVKNYAEEKNAYPDKFPVVQEIVVNTTTLDGEQISPIGFIKIDVEGAEIDVLKGGARTLAEQKPVLLIEIEERHRKDATKDVPNFMLEYGYKGYFIDETVLRPMEEFAADTMQVNKVFPGKVPGYLNNFIFLPKGKEALVDKIKHRLSA
jgi:FkbM family methyltransferase